MAAARDTRPPRRDGAEPYRTVRDAIADLAPGAKPT